MTDQINKGEFTIMPDYYKEFYCLADKCPDTCCKGWGIEIDEETLEKWKRISKELKAGKQNLLPHGHVPEDFVKVIPRGKNDVRYTIQLDHTAHCPFLNEKGLCSIYLTYGDDHTTKICRDFPRSETDYQNMIQRSVAVRCEAVLDLLWKRDRFAYEIYDRTGNLLNREAEAAKNVRFPAKELFDGIIAFGNEKAKSSRQYLETVFSAFYWMHKKLEAAAVVDENGYREYGTEYVTHENTLEMLAYMNEYTCVGKAGKRDNGFKPHHDMMYDLMHDFFESPIFGPAFSDSFLKSKAVLEKSYEEQKRLFKETGFLTEEMERRLILLISAELFTSVFSVEAEDYETLLCRFQWLIMQILAVRHILFVDACHGVSLTDDHVQFRIARLFRVSDHPDIVKIAFFDNELLNWLWTPEYVVEMLQYE